MKSSQPNPEVGAPLEPQTLLVAEGGAPAVSTGCRDPYEALDDLMLLVETLCPAWPPREGLGPMDTLRL
jgi:hypothetical protein